MMRRLWWLAASLSAASLLGLGAAMPASAAGYFNMINYRGQGYYLADENGHNQPLRMEDPGNQASWSEVNGDGSWFELQDGNGLCIDMGSDGFAYAEGCNYGQSTEEFIKSGYLFTNRHFNQNLTGDANLGGYAYVTGTTGTPAQWATP